MSFFQKQTSKEREKDLYESVLMDSGSTCNIFCNPELVTDIRHCGNEGINVHSNGGKKYVDMIADLAGFGEV